MSEPNPCDNRGPRIGEDGTRCRRPSGHVGDHATAPEDGFGDVRWTQWAAPMTSVPPAQPPAAPETDVNALREALAAATPGPWQHFGDHLVWPSERGPAANDPIAGVGEGHQECAALIVAAVNALPALLADLEAARERLRVVEGERDAAVLSWSSAYDRADAAIDRGEAAEAERDEVKAELAVTAEVRDVAQASARLMQARAESAEAAHRALQARLETLAVGMLHEADHLDQLGDHEEAGSVRHYGHAIHTILRAGGDR